MVTRGSFTAGLLVLGSWEYAAQWNVGGDGVTPLTPAAVRGHEAVAYDINGPGTPTLTWQERPGMLVSLAGNAVDPDVRVGCARRDGIEDRAPSRR
jgi:hypothetical protein